MMSAKGRPQVLAAHDGRRPVPCMSSAVSPTCSPRRRSQSLGACLLLCNAPPDARSTAELSTDRRRTVYCFGSPMHLRDVEDNCRTDPISAAASSYGCLQAQQQSRRYHVSPALRQVLDLSLMLLLFYLECDHTSSRSRILRCASFMHLPCLSFTRNPSVPPSSTWTSSNMIV